MNIARSVGSIASVARKEFIHILRDWRILILIFTLPPAFTLLFGHAFEVTELTDAPAMLFDADRSEQSAKLIGQLRGSKTFAWHDAGQTSVEGIDLLKARVQAAIIIPAGWGPGLENGDPLPLRLILDGMDTTSAPQLEGEVLRVLGQFQLDSRQEMIDQLPDSVIEMGRQIPIETRKKFTSSMTPWTTESRTLYNPKLRFIDYVMPGIVGLILQLLTVTLMACTIARERESGTLSQLLVTPLRREEIVIGKVLPYLAVSIVLIGMTLATGRYYFGVFIGDPLLSSVLCLLFLLCSLGTGLLISTFCRTQAQAIQFAVFYLLPVFPLSGAFASLDQLPDSIRIISQTFPLTHFCHAFRLVSLGQAGLPAILGDLCFLAIGAVVTCLGAALLLRRIQD
ncbi:MAG: ABC transporter permease [Chthoniobacteraceae bacterium]